MFFGIIPPSGVALVVGEKHHEIRIALVIDEIDFLLGVALVLHEMPDALVGVGVTLVVGLVHACASLL